MIHLSGIFCAHSLTLQQWRFQYVTLSLNTVASVLCLVPQITSGCSFSPASTSIQALKRSKSNSCFHLSYGASSRGHKGYIVVTSGGAWKDIIKSHLFQKRRCSPRTCVHCKRNPGLMLPTPSAGTVPRKDGCIKEGNLSQLNRR